MTSTGLSIREGFWWLRFVLVLGSLSPIFIVWALRQEDLVPFRLRLSLAIASVIIPNGLLWLRYRSAKATGLAGSFQALKVLRLTDRREHLISYLFPIVLSLLTVDVKTWNQLASFLFVLLLTGVIFWHLQLTYVNVWLALVGFRAVQVEREQTAGGKPLLPIILLTRHRRLKENDEIRAVRITNSLFVQSSAPE
jgi:hypothetical protein